MIYIHPIKLNRAFHEGFGGVLFEAPSASSFQKTPHTVPLKEGTESGGE